MSEVLKKLGRYFLLDQIAQGGMAEIYRARLTAGDGAGRLIVIKRIQSGFGNNPDFLRMFRSEIKVTMGFNHPNIVQLYDFGEEKSQPFIVMEYVDGKNLRQVNARFIDQKKTFPIDLAVNVIGQVASGLHYAHVYTDKISGQPLNVVHRDVSPQNILISYEGQVKIIDFGIAKAATNTEATRAGTIKGKPSYMSPEQINGDPLDGRCDVFSLGIVFWELLTGRKLFSSENDLAVLKLIESSQSFIKPPSTVNPAVPKELDYIVMKSLTKQREKRFQNAEEFHRALHRFIIAYNPDYDPTELSYTVKELFKDEIVDDRKLIQKLNEKVDLLLQAAEPARKAQADDDTDSPTQVRVAQSAEFGEDDRTRVRGSPQMGTGARNFVSQKEKAKDLDVDLSPAQKVVAGYGRRSTTEPGIRIAQPVKLADHHQHTRTRTRPETTLRTRRGLFSSVQAKAVGGALILCLGWAIFGHRASKNTVPLNTSGQDLAELTVDGNQFNVQVYVNDKLVDTRLPTSVTGIAAGVPVTLKVVSEEGTFEKILEFKESEHKTIQPKFERSARKIAQVPGPDRGPPQALLRIKVMPEGGRPVRMVLNGQVLNPTNPVIQVPLDTSLSLEVERSGYQTVKRSFWVSTQEAESAGRSPTGLPEIISTIEMDPLSFGYLNLTAGSITAEARFMVDGQEVVKSVPLVREKLPTGTYRIRVHNELLIAERTITVKIEANRVHSYDVNLQLSNH